MTTPTTGTGWRPVRWALTTVAAAAAALVMVVAPAAAAGPVRVAPTVSSHDWIVTPPDAGAEPLDPTCVNHKCYSCTDPNQWTPCL
jgi:hypothetical protein